MERLWFAVIRSDLECLSQSKKCAFMICQQGGGMLCRCDAEYRDNLELFGGVSDVVELGAALKRIAIQLGFEQAVLIVEFPTPFSRHRCLMIKDRESMWSGAIDDAYIAPLRPILLSCAESAGLVKWSLEDSSLLVPEQGSPQEEPLHGIASGFLSNDGSLYSVLFFRAAKGGKEVSDATLNMRMACVIALIRQVGVDLREEGTCVLNMTSRELEILRWTADGKCASEISRILFISENTVIYHVKKLLAKTGCANKLHVVAQAIGNRLLW
ncbi:LuxR C-terminal-related transcriptional regulator [Pseudomonas sp. NPDC090592]|uniref:helix-turn-helix transcriptional regulator n=1 Tax=Pseudomonas sp. NPDC090592 TaxID=3364480 RepID=UPI00383ADBCB